MLYVPKVNCMYLRYRAGFASRTLLLLVFRWRSISIDWYAHLNTVCSFDNKSWIIAPKISHNMLWTYLTVMAKTKLKLSCIKRTTYKRKSISDHIPSKRLKTFLPGSYQPQWKGATLRVPPKIILAAQLINLQGKRLLLGVHLISKQQSKVVEDNCSLQDQNRKQIVIPVMPMKPFNTILCITRMWMPTSYWMKTTWMDSWIDWLRWYFQKYCHWIMYASFYSLTWSIFCLNEMLDSYQKETLVWWFVLFKQHGEQLLRTCGGMKFLGSCTDEDSTSMKPTSAQINFIVPTPSILRKLKPTTLDVWSRECLAYFKMY